MFAKNERGYRLTAKNNRFWSLLFLLQSVASIRRKLLKTTYTEERSVHTNSESCNIRLGYGQSWTIHKRSSLTVSTGLNYFFLFIKSGHRSYFLSVLWMRVKIFNNFKVETGVQFKVYFLMIQSFIWQNKSLKLQERVNFKKN